MIPIIRMLQIQTRRRHNNANTAITLAFTKSLLPGLYSLLVQWEVSDDLFYFPPTVFKPLYLIL
jgi:hypothetical protein